MILSELPRTKIEVEVPIGHKPWNPWPHDSIRIDGHRVGMGVTIGVKNELDAPAHTVWVNDNRVLYPTDLWVNGVLRSTDNGLLWENRPIGASHAE